jgi:hypothetical protein
MIKRQEKVLPLVITVTNKQTEPRLDIGVVIFQNMPNNLV